jgi:hypothetical protein
MRALVLLAALGAASVAGAQTPATPVPTTQPATVAPKAPKSGGGEFRVGGFMVSGDRSYEFGGNPVNNNTGSMKGIDVVLRSKAIGLQFKSISGEFENQPSVANADLRLLLFPPVFTVMAGVGRRALWSSLNEANPTQYNLGIVGISSTAVIGGSGLRTNFQAAAYVAQKVEASTGGSSGGGSAAQEEPSKGLEGEASVMWRLPKLPFYLQAGYRTEIFTAVSGTRSTPEEVRGMKIGGGMVFGGR